MLKKILLQFTVWRIVLFALAFISPQIIRDFGNKFPYAEILSKDNIPHFIWSFGNFDGVHYIRIAQDGYAYQFTQAFFPVYPILTKFLSLLLGNFLISALLISNLCFLAALFILFKLVEKTHGEKIANWTLIFLLAYPASFYFGAVYTEGFFLLLTTLVFYFAQKNDSIKSTVLGSIATGTRLVGLFFVPALLFEKKLNKVLVVALIPLGFILYVTYLQLEFKNPLYFLTSQEIFGQERSTTSIVLLPQVIYRYIKILATTNGLVLFNASFELLSTLFAAVVLLFGYKKIPMSWLVFSVLSFLLPTLTGTLTSMPRYVASIFPIFVILATVENLKLKSIILLTFFALMFVSVVLFTQGYWLA